MNIVQLANLLSCPRNCIRYTHEYCPATTRFDDCMARQLRRSAGFTLSFQRLYEMPISVTNANFVLHALAPSCCCSVIGMASAVETFCGQAYGARHYRTLGVVLQRAVLLCLVTCCLPIALWVNAAPAMLLLGERASVRACCGEGGAYAAAQPVWLEWYGRPYSCRTGKRVRIFRGHCSS